jgi:polyisoprenoid-binding protein YceI
MATTKWTLDPSHSELQFKIKHLMISTVTGSFNDFSSELTTDSDDFEHSKITFKAGIDSIDTGNSDRDGHLKSADFFNADQFPSITFESTSFKKEGSDYKLTGNLTIKDVTKPVTLDVEFGGQATDPYGNNKVGFSISGKVNRTEFGLTYNAALETGGVVLGEDVKILGELQFVKQA